MGRVFSVNKDGTISTVEEVVESGTIKIGESEPAMYEKKVTRITTVNFANILKDMVDYTQQLLDSNPKQIIDSAYDVIVPFVKLSEQFDGVLDALDETIDTKTFNRKSSGIVAKIYWKLLAHAHRKTITYQKEMIDKAFTMVAGVSDNPDKED